MSKQAAKLNKVLLLSATVTLAACGGGGGGNDSGAGSDPVAITLVNGVDVAAATYDAAVGLEGAGLGGLGPLTGVVTQTDARGIDMADVILAQVEAVQPLIADAQATVTGAQISEQFPCSGGGSMSFTLNDNDNDQELSSGDRLSASFSDCNEDGLTMNGGMSIRNLVITADSTQLSIEANNFSASENGETVVLDGEMNVSEVSTDGSIFTNSLSGTRIRITEAGMVTTLSDFQIESTENFATNSSTLEVSATLSNSNIGGEVSIVTDIPFESIGFDYPSSGQATITGADNSRVTMIALNSVNVRFEIDQDGNGVDQTVDTTWDAL